MVHSVIYRLPRMAVFRAASGCLPTPCACRASNHAGVMTFSQSDRRQLHGIVCSNSRARHVVHAEPPGECR